MKSRTLVILAAAAVVTAGAAIWARGAREARLTPAESRAGQRLFPALRERVNDVVEVAVVTSGGRFEVRRTGTGEAATWGASDKGGYPVDFQKVRGLVVGIANLEILEAKTADPGRLPRLGLQDPSTPGASSKRVTLRDGKGDVLADVILGGEPGAGRVSGRSQYARRSNESQSWEVAGRLMVDERLESWLDKQIVKVERARIREVEVLHPDGERLVVERPGPDVQDFTVRDLPADAKLSWAGVAGSVASALEYLNLEDVLPAGEVDLGGVEPVRADFRAFDGLVVTTRLYTRDDKHYLAVSAAFDPAVRMEPPPPEAPAEGEAPPPAPPALKSVEEVEQEAAAVSERAAPWLYVLPGWAASNLQKRMDDLLAKPSEGMVDDDLDGLDLEQLLRDAQGGGDHEGHGHEESEGASEGSAPPEPAPVEPSEPPAEGGGQPPAPQTPPAPPVEKPAGGGS